MSIKDKDYKPEFTFEPPVDTQFDLGINDKRFDNHFVWIGRITAKWATLEFALDRLICLVTGIPDDAGLCVTSQISTIGRRLDALVSLLHLRNVPEHHLRKLRKLVDATNKLQRKRNSVVHAVWIPGPQDQDTYRLHVRAESVLHARYELSKLPELESLHDEVHHHIVELTDYLFVCIEEMFNLQEEAKKASPKKQL